MGSLITCWICGKRGTVAAATMFYRELTEQPWAALLRGRLFERQVGYILSNYLDYIQLVVLTATCQYVGRPTPTK